MRVSNQIKSTAEHCTDITEEEVCLYLNQIHFKLKCNEWSISLHHEKTNNFLYESNFNISTEDIKEILLALTSKDFCWYQKSEKYENQLVFVFRSDSELLLLTKGMTPQWLEVPLYIKTNLNEIVLVISFHLSDNPDTLKRLFK